MFGKALVNIVTPLALIACTGLGAYPVWRVWRMNTTFQPTEGRVVASSVQSFTRTSDGKESTAWAPVVECTYMVDGRAYRSHAIYPEVMGLPGVRPPDEAEARATVAAYRTGDRVTVYYEPSLPDNSYLRHHYSALPFGLFLLSTTWLPWVLLIPTLSTGTRRSGQTSADPVVQETLELDPGRLLLRWLIVSGVVLAVGASIVGSYYALASPPYEGLISVFAALYIGFAVLICGALLRVIIPPGICLGRGTLRVTGARSSGDGPVRMSLGESVRVSVDQAVRRPAWVRVAELKLVCTVGSGDSRRVVHESTVAFGDDALTPGRDRLRLAADLAVPAEWPDERRPDA